MTPSRFPASTSARRTHLRRASGEQPSFPAIERIASDTALRAKLAATAPASVEELTEPRILERIVHAIVGDGGGDA